MENSGKFRPKRKNFSMVSNSLIRDNSVSLKAKGLYSLIQSYITIEGFVLYKNFLMKQCAEGRTAFDSAWKELKDAGYLIQYRMKNERNQFYYEYDLLDEPARTAGPDKEHAAVSDTMNSAVRNVDDVDNLGDNINIVAEEEIHNNTSISIDEVADQIDQDIFGGDQQVEEIAQLIHEVYSLSDDSTVRINQNTVAAQIVKARFRKLNSNHIQYVLFCLGEVCGKIKNMRNYLLTSLFNSISTMNTYYQNRVQVDY